MAFDLFEDEGGAPARLARYTANKDTLYEGVQRIGLRPMLSAAMQGPIVMNVAAPPEPGWDLQRFADGLKARGVLISNFYNTREPSFRVGCIGAVTPDDMSRAVRAMEAVLLEMGMGRRAA